MLVVKQLKVVREVMDVFINVRTKYIIFLGSTVTLQWIMEWINSACINQVLMDTELKVAAATV